MTARALHGVLHHSSSRRSSGGSWARFAGAREIDQIADEDREVLELAAHRGQDVQRARPAASRRGALEQLDVGADRGQRRAQLVRGVGDELALGIA